MSISHTAASGPLSLPPLPPFGVGGLVRWPRCLPYLRRSLAEVPPAACCFWLFLFPLLLFLLLSLLPVSGVVLPRYGPDAHRNGT